jgi:hypothetical protein
LLPNRFTHLVVLLLWSQYRQEISVRVTPSRDDICRIVKEFEETGSMHNKRTKGHKSNTLVCTEEFIGAARESITRRRRKSVGTTNLGLNQHCMENLS